MRRIKTMIAACGLLAVTAIVFAGKPAFTAGLYADVNGTAVEIASGFNSTNMVSSPSGSGQQAKITNQAGNRQYPLHSDDGLSAPLYLNSAY